MAIDATLDIQQCVDPLDCFERDWRDRQSILPAPGIGREGRQLEELPSRMGATEGGGEQPSENARIVVPVIRVGPRNASEDVKVQRAMLMLAIARGIIKRGRLRTPPGGRSSHA